MSSKRPREDSGEQDSAGHSKKCRYDRNTQQQYKPNHKRPQDSVSLGPIRSRIRSLRRLLEHDDAVDATLLARSAHHHGSRQQEQQEFLHSRDELEIAAKHEARDQKRVKRLPAHIRIEHERELAGLEGQVREVEAKRKRSSMIGKFHMVRFFERRKADRILKRLRREMKEVKIDEDVGRHETLQGRIQTTETARNYAMYYPLDKAYVSLWPKRKGEQDKDDDKGDGDASSWEAPAGDADMWKVVEECTKEGRLEDLKEGRIAGSLGAVDAPAATQQRLTRARPARTANARPANGNPRAGKPGAHTTGAHIDGASRSARRAAAAAARASQADDSDDGGFFEE